MAKALISVLAAALFALVGWVLARVLRNAARGLVRAKREGCYVRSAQGQAGSEPDTVLGWLLAILVMAMALAGLAILLIYIVARVWT